jgi:hypothetical protein
MEVLEATMKKHNINLDSCSSRSSSHRYALFTDGFSFNATTTCYSNWWPIDSRASYHMAKDKAIFSTLNEYNTKHIFVGDDISLSVVGSGTIQLDDGYFNDVLCVPSLPCNLILIYQITHLGEDKTIEFFIHARVRVSTQPLVGMFYRKHVIFIDGKNNIEPNLESVEDEKDQKR